MATSARKALAREGIVPAAHGVAGGRVATTHAITLGIGAESVQEPNWPPLAPAIDFPRGAPPIAVEDVEEFVEHGINPPCRRAQKTPAASKRMSQGLAGRARDSRPRPVRITARSDGHRPAALTRRGLLPLLVPSYRNRPSCQSFVDALHLGLAEPHAWIPIDPGDAPAKSVIRGVTLSRSGEPLLAPPRPGHVRVRAPPRAAGRVPLSTLCSVPHPVRSMNVSHSISAADVFTF